MMLGISVLFFLVVGTEGRNETEASNLVHACLLLW